MLLDLHPPSPEQVSAVGSFIAASPSQIRHFLSLYCLPAFYDQTRLQSVAFQNLLGLTILIENIEQINYKNILFDNPDTSTYMYMAHIRA